MEIKIKTMWICPKKKKKKKKLRVRRLATIMHEHVRDYNSSFT